jgi:heme/copper-type cytochrome/quinol oxidase subunit 3
MTARRTLDVSDLATFSISSKTPLWWGQLFMAFIEGTMFCILIAMYFYIRLSVDMWPPPGVQLPTKVLPAICLGLLILSCAGSYIASEAAKEGNRAGMLFGLVLNMGLGCLGMGARAMDWGLWNFKWTTGAYGSITWAIVFLHTLDIVADLIFTFVLTLLVARGRTGPRVRLGVHVDSVVWYFLVLIWIPLYVVVFWGPYFLGGPV